MKKGQICYLLVYCLLLGLHHQRSVNNFGIDEKEHFGRGCHLYSKNKLNESDSIDEIIKSIVNI